jgi:peroxiredoxin
MPSGAYQWSCAALLLVGATACAASNPSGDGARGPSTTDAPESAEAEGKQPFRVLSPSERVPDFRVVATDGSVIDSSTLVGKEPFVLVFFATWCNVCELKLPEVTSVLAGTERIPVIGVSVDDKETWERVPSFVARHRLAFPTVRGTSFPRFALAYDPLQTVPVVAVIGRNGYLVDYQIGWASSHRSRLAAAIEVGRRIAPDAPPLHGPNDAEPTGRLDADNPNLGH